MWKYVLGILATLSTDPGQRDAMRHDAIVSVSVARASLERVRLREEEEEEEEACNCDLACEGQCGGECCKNCQCEAAKTPVPTQKKEEAPACPDGKCNVVIRRRR